MLWPAEQASSILTEEPTEDDLARSSSRVRFSGDESARPSSRVRFTGDSPAQEDIFRAGSRVRFSGEAAPAQDSTAGDV